jgi:hypothetical protein
MNAISTFAILINSRKNILTKQAATLTLDIYLDLCPKTHMGSRPVGTKSGA